MIKHLHLQPEPDAAAFEYVPRFFCEIRIDVADVRSGLRETHGFAGTVAMSDGDGDSLWTEDMVQPVDTELLRSGLPAQGRIRPLPAEADDAAAGRVETQFLNYLLRYFKVRVFRNSDLGLYSRAGESLEEFTARCRDVLTGSFRREIDAQRELFERKLEQVREKFLRQDRPEPNDFKTFTQLRSRVHDCAERITGMFLQAGFAGMEVQEPGGRPDVRGPELEEKLRTVEHEACREIGKLVRVYQDKLDSIDAYVIRPGIREIHIVRTGVLWVPERLQV